MLSSELFDLEEAITLVHHLVRACEASSCGLDRSAVFVSAPPLPISHDRCSLPWSRTVTAERKEVIMARLMSIAAAAALVLSAAFAAGLTCGG
jgi:hypothetical protein